MAAEQRWANARCADMSIMAGTMKSNLKVIVCAGLALGGVLGLAGTLVAARNIRTLCWGVDAVGLVVATSILALSYFQKEKIAVAAGFLVFAIGESVMLSGTAASLEASVPSFAAGTALWSAALLLTCAPREFALWTRAVGVVGAALFGITSVRIFWGTPLTPLARPLPSFAYPFLVLTLAGWIWKVLKEA